MIGFFYTYHLKVGPKKLKTNPLPRTSVRGHKVGSEAGMLNKRSFNHDNSPSSCNRRIVLRLFLQNRPLFRKNLKS